MKCIIKNCVNKKDAGRFVGDICGSCYIYLAENKGNTSQAYRNEQELIGLIKNAFRQKLRESRHEVSINDLQLGFIYGIIDATNKVDK